LDSDYVFQYTRQDALSDGVLKEVPVLMLMEVGINYHTAMTETVFALVEGDLLGFLRFYVDVIRSSKVNGDTMTLTYQGQNMWAKCHPGDDGITPCITIMLEGED
jgi:hypothetical protein